MTESTALPTDSGAAVEPVAAQAATTITPGPVATESATDLVLRGLKHSVDLRALGFWMALPALAIEQEYGPIAPGNSLEGVWELFVEIDLGDQVVDTGGAVRFEFRADHTIKAVSKATADDGLPYFIGIGYWISFPDGTFFFGIHHPGLSDGQGGDNGAIYGLHRGRIENDAVVTSATAVIDQGAGQPWLGPLTVQARGSRVPDQGEQA